MNRKYTTILFDADNTLLDFDKDEDCALKKVMAEYGVPITEETVATYISINVGMWKALERGEITKPELKRTRFKKFFEAIGFETEADPCEVNERYLFLLGEGENVLEGAVDLCRELREKGFDLYIITNGVTNTQKRRMGRSGLLPFITKCFISETLGHQKPKKEFFDIVLDRIPEKDTKKIIVVGDSLTSDIRGAMNAGLDSVWVNMKGADLPEEYTPQYTIKDIREFREIILGK